MNICIKYQTAVIIKILSALIFGLYASSVISQTLQQDYQRNQQAQQKRVKKLEMEAQAEAQVIEAARKYGRVVYCEQDNYIFYDGRVFVGTPNTEIVGKFFNLDTGRSEEKLFYQDKGSWISFRRDLIINEINLTTGDLYMNFGNNYIEKKKPCKRIR